MNRRKIKAFLNEKFAKDQAKSLLERYDSLYYSDIQGKYEEYIKNNSIKNVITLADILSVELQEMILLKKDPASSYLVQDTVLMILGQDAEKRTMEELSEALASGNEKVLKRILSEQDPDGKYCEIVIKSCS